MARPRPSDAPIVDVPPAPAARRLDLVEEVHGRLVDDPYRWLEADDDEEVTAWVAAQNGRSRAVLDPRSVLAAFGLVLPPEKAIRVWDSTAEIRYLVVPERPAGSQGWSAERLATLVTRDSMIGTGLALDPADAP